MIPLLSGGLSTSATSGAGSGDISAGFINNAGLVVGGSGKVAADTGSAGAADGPTSALPMIIIAGFAVLGIVTILILKK
jgi:hypothetical protein